MIENSSSTQDLAPTESTSLIFKPLNNPFDIDLNNLNAKDYLKECWNIYLSSVPVFLGSIVQKMIAYSSLFFIGQYLGKEEMAAASLSNMFATITGWSLALSMSSVLNTLCSQAFTGSSDLSLVGVYLQRGILITCSMFIPIGIVWWNTEYILNLLGVDAQLAANCGTFLSILLLGSVPYIVFSCIRSFMLAQGITSAQSHIAMIVLPVHIFFNYMLIANPSTSLGFVGAPLATVLSYWVMLILSLMYVVFIDGYQAWGGWSKKSLKGWGPFIKMGLSNIIMTCSEWWAFEILALGASYLGVLSLASYSVIMSLTDLFWNVSYGIATIASNTAGNLIGESMVNKTIFIIRCAFITSFICSCINISIILGFNRFLASLFTQDLEVIELAASTLHYAAFYQIFDGLSTVSGFILRGQGRHNIGAIINALCYYLISIPLGFFLAFHMNFGLSGFYIGIIVTLIVTSSTLIYSVISSNWDDIIKHCRVRLNAENQSDL
ncbi:MATE efflux family protein [Conidiobolus coronatus NRRL 28638]|uniref:MATE efflux family protein n=1 Tax=Conidiobolus coronatus (strain ATCC 28846 / CBS 209.66 / NRRL 28638) TaxID=796925 RepID=A0A137PA67_CONC2|nr:MATE efflux family protein [Conidiobolus coronatus NRRL 28638]|eukprot:KXN71896.1 MATE efflux family protein [Conidiobolus coronatus NRRL 28638]